MKDRLLLGACALLTCLGTLAGTASAGTAAPARSAAAAPAVHYYLALGDSLSVGYQPNSKGVGIETNQGYANDIYALAKKRIPNLKLVELGCPGETTTSMLTGKGNVPAAKHFRCDRAGGSQLTAAVRFLKAHARRGEVPLITLDIGANDVDNCVSGADLNAVIACVGTGVHQLEANTPKILTRIRTAAPKGTALAAMNLYDPVLADELSSSSSTQNLGSLSLGLVKSINAAITRADAAAHFRTANVARAFGTYDTAPMSTAGTSLAASGASSVPADVLNICQLTWMCAAPPVGPNIHANKQGYRLIAGAFASILPNTI